MVIARAAGVQSMRMLTSRLRAGLERLRDDSRGGAYVVLAYAVIAVAIVGGITSFAITNGYASLSQRITQAAEASLRSTVDTVLAEVNQGGPGGPSAKLEELASRQFVITADGPVQGQTTIEAATYDGTQIHLDLSIKSTGRISWERQGRATLDLARATSLSQLVDGRAVWDYAAPSGAHSTADQVVALWTPGELSVYTPGADAALPTAPTPAKLTSDLSSDGTATFTATYVGGCLPGEDPRLQTRAQFVGGDQQPWKGAATSSQFLATGAQIRFEARVRCVGAERTSNWSMSETSLIRSATVPTPPAPEVIVASNGSVSVTVPAAEASPGTSISVQVRIRVDGGVWSAWSNAENLAAGLSAGESVDAQTRIRQQTSAGDSGWVESPLVSRAFTG